KRPYVIRGKVGGEVPASLTIEIEGQGVKRVALKPDNDAWTSASFSAALDMTKQQGEFRFRVVANDASFPPQTGAWHKVQVVPPPRLALLNGRPSPQIEYHFPAYTDLASPYQVSPGAKNIEVFAGTQVVYRAAVDRPVERAWIEFRPRDEAAKPALIASTIAAPHTLDLLTRLAGGHAVWGKVLPDTSPSRTRLTFTFQPWVSGNYALRLEDADALVLDDEADLQVLADPIPQVLLLQPSGKQTL